MKQECLKIGQTPAIIYGDASTHAWLFVHGMGGNKTEAEPFAALTGAQVLAIDLPAMVNARIWRASILGQPRPSCAR